jgi:putative oxidoreductase
MQVQSLLKDNKWHEITHWGLRAALGVTFLVHSIKKFDPSWQAWLVDKAGLPAEMQLPIALAEFIGGILLISGVLTRITGIVFSIILLGAIFHIRGIGEFFISNGGYEWDMIMLAVSLTIIAAGPGRISIAHLVKKIPKFLH